MPFITPKQTVPAVSMSWDAFPAPPPDAEKWQPPEDAIPKPSAVRDSRFSRDTAQDGRSKAYFKEAKMYGMLADKTMSSASVGNTPPAPGLGQWPAPVSRPSGPPISGNGDHIKSMSSIGASVPTLTSLNSTSVKQQTAKTGGDDLADTVPAMTKSVLEEERSQSPLVSSNPANPSHPKAPMPAWAARLEKAIKEDTRKVAPQPAVTMTAQAQVGPEIVNKSSIPPHRRVQPDQMKTRSLNPAAKVYGISASTRHTIGQTGTPSTLSTDPLMNEKGSTVNNHATTLVTTKPRPESTQQVIDGSSEAIRTHGIEQPISTNATGNRNHVGHDHKIKVMLVRAMEHELDLYNVATERELMRMAREDLNRYYEKAFSAHQCWWEAKNGA